MSSAILCIHQNINFLITASKSLRPSCRRLELWHVLFTVLAFLHLCPSHSLISSNYIWCIYSWTEEIQSTAEVDNLRSDYKTVKSIQFQHAFQWKLHWAFNHKGKVVQDYLDYKEEQYVCLIYSGKTNRKYWNNLMKIKPTYGKKKIFHKNSSKKLEKIYFLLFKEKLITSKDISSKTCTQNKWEEFSMLFWPRETCSYAYTGF